MAPLRRPTATPMEGLNFAHFANGVDGPLTNISDIVLVNVDTSTVNSAIYFYSQAGEIIPADYGGGYDWRHGVHR